MPSRREIVKTAVSLTAAASLGVRAACARTEERHATVAGIDAMLRDATGAGRLPGVVAMAASENDVLYEGYFGRRRLDEGPAMTRDTVFRVASMVKLITSVAALQLVEQNKLSLDAAVPEIDPALGSPQVLEGFDGKGLPKLRPAMRPITLRHLLTHTAGFAYRLWDAKALQYAASIEHLTGPQKAIVEFVSGDSIDVYFRKNIFDPLGMKDTAFVISPGQREREASLHRRKVDGSLAAQPMERQSTKQRFSGGGGIYSTAPDYLTLIRALLRGGALNGVRVLRPETVALMGQNQIGKIDVGVLRTTSPSLSNDVDLCPGVNLKWGFGHLINMEAVAHGRSAGSLTWGGLFNTYYWIDPGKAVAAVFMTQLLPFADRDTLRLYGQFERGIYALMNRVRA
jgi:CubicO group peptidase (beta-lactamase class C family)